MISTKFEPRRPKLGWFRPKLDRFRPNLGRLERLLAFNEHWDGFEQTRGCFDSFGAVSTTFGLISAKFGPVSDCNSSACGANQLRGGAKETPVALAVDNGESPMGGPKFDRAEVRPDMISGLEDALFLRRCVWL